MRTLGLILAGGEGRRLGGIDKARLQFRGAPLLKQVAERLAPQVDSVALSGRRSMALLPGFERIEDESDTAEGPLAGVIAGLRYAHGRNFAQLVSVPVDAPFFPVDLVSHLQTALDTRRAAAAIVADGERPNPVFALYRVSALDAVETAWREGVRALRDLSRYLSVAIWFCPSRSLWEDIDTEEDLKRMSL